MSLKIREKIDYPIRVMLVNIQRGNLSFGSTGLFFYSKVLHTQKRFFCHWAFKYRNHLLNIFKMLLIKFGTWYK